MNSGRRAPDHPRPLAGLGVVVTRPAHQAGELCALIEAAGGRALRFPVLEIVDPTDTAPLDRIIDHLDDYDLAVFISPNAVHRGLRLILSRREFPDRLKIAVIGRASARELARGGHRADICPARRFDSEALLAMEELQHMAGQRVLIFRGEGGRELLAETLRARGARVEYAEVYRRVRADPDRGELLHQWERGTVDVVITTSNEGLRNLCELVGEAGRRRLRNTALVVINDRMLQLARELGFTGDLIVAGQAGDQALVEAIGNWHRGAPTDDPSPPI